MPKKTKREKVIAELRRKSGTHNSQSTFTPTGQHSTAPTFRFSGFDNKATAPTALVQTNDLLAIKRDVLKTLILAAAAIAVEFALFFFEKGKL